MRTETTHLDPNAIPIPYSPAIRRGIAAVGRLPGATYLNSARATVHALCATLAVDEIARSVADELAGRDVHTLVMRRPGESHREQADRIGQWAAEIIVASVLGTAS